MKYALLFITLAVGCGYGAWSADRLAGRLLSADVMVCCGLISAGFAWVGPGIFIKRSDGRLHIFSYILLWPYHLVKGVIFLAVRRLSSANPIDEIESGLFLGRRLFHGDAQMIREIGFHSVLDVTCELSELEALRATSYRCIPLLDNLAPGEEQLAQGVSFIARAPRPVLVHCAAGHGRSATFLAAYLLTSGEATTAAEAEAILRRKRPGVRLNRAQRRVVDRFAGRGR